MNEFEHLVKTLKASNRAEVLEALLALTPTQRKSLGPKFRRSLTDRGGDFARNHDLDALGVVATADGPRQASVVTTVSGVSSEECLGDIVTILASRRPAWLSQFVELVQESDWLIVQGLVRTGLVAAPESEEYLRDTILALADTYSHQTRSLADRLTADPDIAGDHLIRMLSIAGVGEALFSHDSWVDDPNTDRLFKDQSWRAALVTLTTQHFLDRGELLDVVLLAPLRDWDPADLRWFVGMHKALAPDADEIVARQSTYSRLLRVVYGPSVRAAQQALTRIVGDARFESGLVVDASAATLSRPDKAVVAAQLTLLEKVHKAHPGVSIVDAVRIATDHPRADIREQAEQLLHQVGAGSPVLPAQKFIAPPSSRRPTAAPVEPVASADELAEVLLQLLEEVDPIAMERAIDGLLRYAADSPSTADLLLARAEAVARELNETGTAAVTLVRAWLVPRTQAKKDWTVTLAFYGFCDKPALPATSVGAMARRLSMIAEAIRTGPHPSVALPSRADGSIEVEALNGRLRYDPAENLTEFELAIAVLRVCPENRGNIAIPAAFRDSRPVTRALQTPGATWVRKVVTYQRESYEPRHRIPTYRDTSAVEGDALDGIVARRRPGRTAAKEMRYDEWGGQFEHTLAMTALLNPHDVDALAAHAHPFLYRDLGKTRAVGVPLIDAIARATRVIGAPASSALVLGLAAKDARAQTAAQDALLDLADYGLLDGAGLGGEAALHLNDQIVVGSRVSAGFAAVARASDAAVVPILDALQQLMPALPGRKDAGPFVELTAELSGHTGRPVELPSEFHSIAAGKSSSMLAKALRRLT